jgi:beta-glucosidase
MELDKKEYSKNESILISGDVYNMGNRDGSEVVQVYVGKLN